VVVAKTAGDPRSCRRASQEGEKVTTVRVESTRAVDERTEPVVTAPQIHGIDREVNLCAGRDSQHAPPIAAMSVAA
jgi:hypothetical protein